MIYQDIKNAKFVPYLKTGHVANAETWNTLYSEMDKRVNAATNGRSILYLNTPAQYMVEGSNPFMAPFWMNAHNPLINQKISDWPEEVNGLIGDRQFYFLSGAVTGEDGRFPASKPRCKRCADDMWQTHNFASEADCQKVNCNYSLTDFAGFYWKLWGQLFLRDDTNVHGTYKHEYFEDIVNHSYVIDVNHKRNVALVIEARHNYTRGRGRETPIFRTLVNSKIAKGGNNNFGEGTVEHYAPATCPQAPFLYCQNLDNSLAIHTLSDDHPQDYISIDCVPQSSKTSSDYGDMTGVVQSTGMFDSGNNSNFYQSGSGDCIQCDNAMWLTDTSTPYGQFYSEDECRVYYGCDAYTIETPSDSTFQEVCPQAVVGENLKLGGKRIISYGNWGYDSPMGWHRDKLVKESNQLENSDRTQVGDDDDNYISYNSTILRHNLNSENRTSQAEIFIDGYRSIYENFKFKKEWNKYKFFRIHNLNYYDITFTFEPDEIEGGGTLEGAEYDADGVWIKGVDDEGNEKKYAVTECGAGPGTGITIKGGESRCVRRDFGKYTLGYNHFQKFKQGDAKYSFQLGLMGSTTAAYPTYSNPYVRSEESNFRDFVNNVNNPFILRRYHQTLINNRYIQLDEAWPRNWDAYHEYVDTKDYQDKNPIGNETAKPIETIFSGVEPWSRLRQPRQYTFEDFNPYDPNTNIADLIYSTGYVLRSTVVRSGEEMDNSWAGTSAAAVNPQLFEIDASVKQIKYVYNLSLIPYTGSRYLEEFLYNLGVNLFPAQPFSDSIINLQKFRTPRSEYGGNAMMNMGWSGMYAGPKRMLAGEGLYKEPFVMTDMGCVPHSAGTDIGLEHILDPIQKSQSKHALKDEYTYMGATAKKGAFLPETYGNKLGYGGTWEKFVETSTINDEGGNPRLRHGTRIDGTTDVVYHVGDKDKGLDNISCISGIREEIFGEWYNTDVPDGRYNSDGWHKFTSSTTTFPPDPFAHHIQVMPVSTNVLGRGNELNSTLQLYPLGRPALDPPPFGCNCHDQHLVSMIDTLYGHNVSLGNYYWSNVIKRQTRRGDTIEILPVSQTAWTGPNDQRKARMVFYDNNFYGTATAGHWNHYKLYPEKVGPGHGMGGGTDNVGKVYPYYYDWEGIYPTALGTYQSEITGTQYTDDWHWDGLRSADTPQRPVWWKINESTRKGGNWEGDSYYLNPMDPVMPVDIIEVSPFYKPVYYADPMPGRKFGTYQKWVGMYNSYSYYHTNLWRDYMALRCHLCNDSYTTDGNHLKNCLCNDEHKFIDSYHAADPVSPFADEAGLGDYAFMHAPDFDANGWTENHANYDPDAAPHRLPKYQSFPNHINQSQSLPVHIDYLNTSNRYGYYKKLKHAAMPLHHYKVPNLPFDYDATSNPNQKQHGRDNYRGLFQTNIYDLHETINEFNKADGLWTGYRSYNDSHYATWDYSDEQIDKDNYYQEVKPITKYTRPGPILAKMLEQVDNVGGVPKGKTVHGFSHSDVADGTFQNSLHTFMDPELVTMGANDPFKFHKTDGGIGYANVRFGDNQHISYDTQKNANLTRLNREALYSFVAPKVGDEASLALQSTTQFDEGMEILPDVAGYPEGTPVLFSRQNTVIDKYYEYGCAYRNESVGSRPSYGDNSYNVRGARSVLDGARLSVGGRNSLYSFQHANRVPEYYSAMNPSVETIWNLGEAKELLLAESGFKYLHPDILSTEHMREIRHGKVRNRPIGGWQQENLYEKFIFGYPRAFEWMDNFSSQQEQAHWTYKDILDQPVNYEWDQQLREFGPPMGIYVIEQAIKSEPFYSSNYNGINHDSTVNPPVIGKGLISSPEGEGYWAECSGYYEKGMSGLLTAEDLENFSGYCPHVHIRDFQGRTGDSEYFRLNPYCDQKPHEAWCEAWPYMQLHKDEKHAVIKGAIVRGTGVWFGYPPKVDLYQPEYWPPTKSFSFTDANGNTRTIEPPDSTHESGRGGQVYPMFSGYPDIPWLESFCLSGVITETTSDYGTFQNATDMALEKFIFRRFGVRRHDKYPCYGDLWPSCPHDVSVEL